MPYMLYSSSFHFPFHYPYVSSICSYESADHRGSQSLNPSFRCSDRLGNREVILMKDLELKEKRSGLEAKHLYGYLKQSFWASIPH